MRCCWAIEEIDAPLSPPPGGGAPSRALSPDGVPSCVVVCVGVGRAGRGRRAERRSTGGPTSREGGGGGGRDDRKQHPNTHPDETEAGVASAPLGSTESSAEKAPHARISLQVTIALSVRSSSTDTDTAAGASGI